MRVGFSSCLASVRRPEKQKGKNGKAIIGFCKPRLTGAVLLFSAYGVRRVPVAYGRRDLILVGRWSPDQNNSLALGVLSFLKSRAKNRRLFIHFLLIVCFVDIRSTEHEFSFLNKSE